jgi:hypothetical protein
MVSGVPTPSAAPGPRPLLDASPQVIRAGLLPEEAGDFDREFRQAMADATETLDLTDVLALLQRWERVARSSSRDERGHRRMLQHADRLTAGGDIATEPWTQTKARLGR